MSKLTPQEELESLEMQIQVLYWKGYNDEKLNDRYTKIIKQKYGIGRNKNRNVFK